jgi:ectoine hydroxylase-related dioxygenase (phytanoyl-CoA dioxygenase family)
MLGFIVMIDAFTAENGATRFWPGSHQRMAAGETGPVPEAALVAACGPAGAVVVYNGSVRHGHGPNHTDLPRRSIQGAYIRRELVGFGLPDRTQPETIERLSMLAKYLIAV